MNHPILTQMRLLKLYGLVWIILLAVHVMINWLVYHVPIATALADGLVYNILMFFLGLSVWFPIFYMDRSKDKISLLVQYIIVGAVLVSVWLFLGYQILSITLSTEALDLLFVKNAFVIRATLGGLMFVLFVMIYYMLIFYNELEEKNRQHETMNRLLRETELNALKSQLNPHFLFNSLNSVSSLTISDPDLAREMINKLSDFMRYSLKKNEDKLLPLHEELRNIARYMAIEKVRFGDRLQCESEVTEQCREMKIPVLLLQPIFENAVKHGVYESIEPVNIRTYCRVVENDLEISIINDYENDDSPHKGEGVGLANVRDRLQLIYNRTDLLTITKENHYFEVVLLIPQV